MFAPTWVFSVPRVFEKIYNGAEKAAGGGMKGQIFEEAARCRRAVVARARRPASRRSLTKAQHAVFDKLVYSKVRAATRRQAALGHLGRRAARRAARPLLQRPRRHGAGGLRPHRDHGCGHGQHAGPHEDRHRRAADARRDHPHRRGRRDASSRVGVVFKGYWRNDEATEAALATTAGSHTGDLGSLDDEGFLPHHRPQEGPHHHGRRQERAAGRAGGRRPGEPARQPVRRGRRRHARSSPRSSRSTPRSCVVWAQRHGQPAADRRRSSSSSWRTTPTLRACDPAVDRRGQQARCRGPRASASSACCPRELTIEGGELTPTLKVKRNVVLKEFAGVVDELYGSPPSASRRRCRRGARGPSGRGSRGSGS